MGSLASLAASLRAMASSPVPSGALENAVDTAAKVTQRSAPATKLSVEKMGNGLRVTVSGRPVRTTQGYVHPAVVFRTALNRLLPDVVEQTKVKIREGL